MNARRTTTLPARLNDGLNIYVNAAKAAAKAEFLPNISNAAVIGTMGMLVLTMPSSAEVVVTMAHQPIKGQFMLDLNNDGVADVSIWASYSVDFSTTFKYFGGMSAIGLRGNAILMSSQGWAAANLPGQEVGSKGTFRAEAGMAFCRISPPDSTFIGPWLSAKNRFLGIRFNIGGETHYGWARLNVGCSSGTLTAYAYETVPDKPIFTGGPLASPKSMNQNAARRPLGDLALGWRHTAP